MLTAMLLASGVIAAVAPHRDLAAFEATLRQRDSATLALEDWCKARKLADPPQILAIGSREANIAASPEIAEHLALQSHESVSLRNVELSCGDTVLSVAWNWYVPERLTPAMNETLNTTRTPFGKVIAPLRFRRIALERISGPAENCPPDTISTHRARLIGADGRPLAYLVECYTQANLAPVS